MACPNIRKCLGSWQLIIQLWVFLAFAFPQAAAVMCDSNSIKIEQEIWVTNWESLRQAGRIVSLHGSRWILVALITSQVNSNLFKSSSVFSQGSYLIFLLSPTSTGLCPLENALFRLSAWDIVSLSPWYPFWMLSPTLGGQPSWNVSPFGWIEPHSIPSRKEMEVI